MHWIILGVLALALVVISVRHPRLAFAILVVLLGSAILLLQIIPGERERQSARILVNDVDVLTVKFVPSYADSRGIALNNLKKIGFSDVFGLFRTC